MNRTIFIVLAGIFVIATISIFTFFGSESGPLSTFRLKPDKKTVLFAVTPWGEPRQMKKAYKPLLNYLSKESGKKFQLLIMEDYDTAIDHIVEGGIDIFVLPPVSYVIAKGKEPGIQYIATQMREENGKRFATYKAYIVALKSKYADWNLDHFLKHAKDFHFGFVTQTSSSGYVYPMAMMKRRGIDPQKDFKKITIFENHPLLTDAIVKGKIDLGATWEHNLEKAQKKHGDQFSIVETTAVIPGITWVASKNVDPAFVKKMRETLLTLSRSPKRGKWLKETPDKGWEVVPDNFYDEVKEILNYVKATP